MPRPQDGFCHCSIADKQSGGHRAGRQRRARSYRGCGIDRATCRADSASNQPRTLWPPRWRRAARSSRQEPPSRPVRGGACYEAYLIWPGTRLWMVHGTLCRNRPGPDKLISTLCNPAAAPCRHWTRARTPPQQPWGCDATRQGVQPTHRPAQPAKPQRPFTVTQLCTRARPAQTGGVSQPHRRKPC